MRLHVWTDLAPPRQAQTIWLQQCTMLESAVLTWPWACCASNCTLFAALPCFFRSRYVRATTLLSISHGTGKKVVSVVVIFKKSKSPVISTCLSKESALPGVFVDFSVTRGELPPPRYGCWRLLAHELHRRKLSLRTCRSNSVSFHFTQTFPEKFLSSPIMPCSRLFFNVRNRAFPMSDCM